MAVTQHEDMAPPDHVPTLVALGVVAYTAETLLHEAVGHGGVCLVSGGRFLILAPLWMRCSTTSLAMIAAGPALNLIGAGMFLAMLRLAPVRPAALAVFLWLSFAFNALVAFGYVLVGAAAGFGDWPALFGWVSLPILWRLPAAAIAIGGFVLCRQIAARVFADFAGLASSGRLRRRSMIPAAGAAWVACLAEIIGGRTDIMPLLLALGCTLGIGISLAGATVSPGRSAGTDLGPVRASPWFLGFAAFVAGLFVFAVGPGLIVQR